MLVPKKDGGERLCSDYLPVNEFTHTDVYPLPCAGEVLDTLGPAKYFSKLDQKSDYWQIAVEPSDRHSICNRERILGVCVDAFWAHFSTTEADGQHSGGFAVEDSDDVP